MKNKSIVIALALLMAVGVSSKTRIINMPDIEYFTSNKFVISAYYYGTNLIFNKDHTYSLSYGMEENGSSDQGRFVIEKNRLVLKPRKCSRYENGRTYNDCNRTMGEATCVIEENDTSIEYERYLVCAPATSKKVGMPEGDDIRFPLADSVVPEGKKRTIGKEPAVTSGGKKGLTSANLKMRETPSLEGKEISYRAMPFDKPLPYIPRNTEIVLLARTKEKQRIDDQNDYWYYVKAGQFLKGWVFGGYVKNIR